MQQNVTDLTRVELYVILLSKYLTSKLESLRSQDYRGETKSFDTDFPRNSVKMGRTQVVQGYLTHTASTPVAGDTSHTLRWNCLQTSISLF